MIGNTEQRHAGSMPEHSSNAETMEEATQLLASIVGRESTVVKADTEEDAEALRQRLIELGVLAEGTPISLSEQRKPYLGQ